jgi:predicted NUDIX family NTP pyrophosphohydrolase
MGVKSAGLLVFRRVQSSLEFFLVHPGGPFYKNKDLGVWSIPKGEYSDDEDALDAAKREFEEETGQKISGKFIALTPIKQKSGKQVTAFAVESDADAESINCNTFSMEWPPKSGKQQQFPEVDKAAWFSENEAREKILSAQGRLIDELISIVQQ